MKHLPIRALVVLSIALLAGCAGVPRPIPVPLERCWSEAEQLGERTRLYATATEASALVAAGRLLRLAGDDDVKVERSPHGLHAEFHRKRWFYLLLVAHVASVWDQWNVTTREEAGGVRVCVQVRGQYFSDTYVLGAEPMSNVIYPASATESDPGSGFKPPARAYAVDYDTFWARLDYLLGLTPTWARCAPGGSGGIRDSASRGRQEMNPLCHALVDDASAPQTHTQ